MTFYPTDCFEILNFAAKIWVIGRYYNQLPFFLLPYVALVVRGSGGGKTTRPFPTPSTSAARLQARISSGGSAGAWNARADLGETVETAPAAHGTDSADTWTSEAPVVSLGAPSREGQGGQDFRIRRRRLESGAAAPATKTRGGGEATKQGAATKQSS